MHFLCKCGYRMLDNTDCLSYKCRIIADQDIDEFWDLIYKRSEISQNENSDMTRTEVYAIDSRLDNIMERFMYQCPSCGRLFLENPDERAGLIMFTPCSDGEPEPDVNRKLLISSHGERWKGFLSADWYDDKPKWSDYHGLIIPIVNIELEDLYFNDYEAFEKRFYELFEHLKALNIISYAKLNVNKKNIFKWRIYSYWYC